MFLTWDEAEMVTLELENWFEAESEGLMLRAELRARRRRRSFNNDPLILKYHAFISFISR